MKNSVFLQKKQMPRVGQPQTRAQDRDPPPSPGSCQLWGSPTSQPHPTPKACAGICAGELGNSHPHREQSPHPPRLARQILRP